MLKLNYNELIVNVGNTIIVNSVAIGNLNKGYVINCENNLMLLKNSNIGNRRKGYCSTFIMICVYFPLTH